MLVIANKSFRYGGNDIQSGQELDIEDTRLASRLVRTRKCVEPDQTSVDTRLVVTNRPVSSVVEREPVTDKNGNNVVEWVVMDGSVGRETPRYVSFHEAEKQVFPMGFVKTQPDPSQPVKYKLVRYRTVDKHTTKRGFEWFGRWLDPGDTLPDDNRLTARKKRNLLTAGWIKETPVETQDDPKPKKRGRPKGSKNKRKTKRRSKSTNTRAA